MSSDKKDTIFEKLIKLISGFGDTLYNIEEQLDTLNQRISRLEYKIDQVRKGEEDLEPSSVEGEFKRLEKKLNGSPFTAAELKELEDMEKEFGSLNDDIDLKELEELEKE